MTEIQTKNAALFMFALLSIAFLLLLFWRLSHESKPQHTTLIYLETQVYDVAGLDEDQYVLRWYDPETKRVIQVDVRGEENAERVRREIEGK